MSRYDFVPLPPRARLADRTEARHDRREGGTLSGRITLSYLCQQPVHIGSGYKDLITNEVVRLTAREGDVPVVPGASFKGALRARFEAITRSCLLFAPPDRRKVISQSRPDVRQARLGQGAERQMRELLTRCIGPRDGRAPRVCPSCALFGCLNLRARVAVSSLRPAVGTQVMLERVPALFEPRLHHVGPVHVEDGPGDRTFVVDGLHGRKFARGTEPEAPARLAVEVLPRGTVLAGEIRLMNVTPAELGGLLCAAGILPASALKVGAAKGHGLGRLDAREFDLTLMDAGRKPVDAEESTYQRAFEDSPDHFEEGLRSLVKLHQDTKL